ncbi:MAG: ribonuclease PH [Deltaproteobacteria bacterium]|nr:ribonuclease PH [Deltaproteobacteria bacterium]
MRDDGRTSGQLRPIQITPNFLEHAEGSALVDWGKTRVICSASVEKKVPPFLEGTGRGWVTAEYAMLPRATHTRKPRESTRGKVDGRTQEIQRLIGRSLRAIVDTAALGPLQIFIDCDVIQADGGTRTASVTGAYVALALALGKLRDAGSFVRLPLIDSVAAVSVGLAGGEVLTDLCYREDAKADVDMNFVITGAGSFVEVQGTAESRPFNRTQLSLLTDAAVRAVSEIREIQRSALAGVGAGFP